MSALLTDLAGRLSERWAAQLAVPGVAWLAAAFCAYVLGHGHALDLPRLTSRADSLIEDASGMTAGSAIALTAAFAVAATVVAYVARGIGKGIERRWFADTNPRWMAAVLPVKRLPELRDRLRDCYSVELATVWPALWIHLPEHDRQEVVEARSKVRDAAALLGWGVLSVLLAAFWWPMLIAAAVLLWIGRQRSWVAADDFARTVEAAVQVHTGELAVRLGLAEHGPVDRSLGWRLTAHLEDNRKFELTERHRTEE